MIFGQYVLQPHTIESSTASDTASTPTASVMFLSETFCTLFE
jgi:hypothetical protein